MESPGNDDSFVSISLDGKECDICLQDTGQDLTTCDVCARFLTTGPVQEGFNELPEVIHTDTLGHPSCFRKFHKLARRLSRSAVKLQNNSPTDGSTQWLNFNCNNLGNELLLENIRNRVSKSNPGSRSGSPQFSGVRQIGKLKDTERCRSEPFLESSAHELRRGYTKYLFGKREGGNGQSVKVPEGSPGLVQDGSHGPINEVPGAAVNHEQKDRDLSNKQASCHPENSRPNSCQSNHDQYLMKTVSCLSIHDEKPHRLVDNREAETCRHSRTIIGHEEMRHSNSDGDDSHRSVKENKNYLPSDEKETWRNVRHIDKEALPLLEIAELRSHTEMLQHAVNDACSQLVQHLQEKDVLSSEVASRHVTIKKLVERQKSLHH
ncbi:uncharacterized protein LOC121420303 isoform X2 [Lytechinus variegatus]|uniref:uncharacterized protein LOC121420303 isoform X2 n=1 Tax=Lytechinus variegatus TaxID=7654 RepID=UPI001BB15537|nr:uncharacterized protein LOC121420303 isoform X2 [Lytechinus variegatus]